MAEAIFAAGNAPARPAPTLPPADLVGKLNGIEALLGGAAALLDGNGPAQQLLDDAAARLASVRDGIASGDAAPQSAELRRHFTRDPERLKLIHAAGAQIDGLLGLLIDAGTNPGPDIDALLGALIRARDLAGCVIYATSVDGEAIDELRLQVYGTRRATTGAAS